MLSLRKVFNESLQEVRSNRTVQYGFLAIALLFCVELALAWSDALSAKEMQLRQLRSELRVLRNQSRDEEALRDQLVSLDNSQKTIEQRLWFASSDAVGQARLKDWLTTIVKKAGAKNFNLVLSSPRAMGAPEGSADSEKASSGVSGAGARPSFANAKGKESAQRLREIRASLTLPFTPASLEEILSDIEGGEPLATVESLNVSRRDRKVDMTVRVLMQLGEPDFLPTASAKGTAATAEQPSSPPRLVATDLEKAVPRELQQQPVPGTAEVKR